MSQISVVVPCYNARPWIGAALQSCLNQDVHDMEIIVVDDGSTDGSAELVSDEFPMVRLIRSPRQGPSRARNIGTAQARGAFIQYLDADDLLADGKLRGQLAALQEAGADVAYGDWRELWECPDGTDRLGAHVKQRIEGPPEIALFTDFWCPPAAYLFRRSIVERVGAWNEELPIIQDARFVLDCALRGGRFVYCPGVSAYYRLHSGGSVSTRDRPGFIRDRFRNAASIEAWWTQSGNLTPARTSALLKVYGQVARDSHGRDKELFDAACAALERLQPGYVPSSPWHLAMASRIVGYRRAETVAVQYRHAKHFLRSALHR